MGEDDMATAKGWMESEMMNTKTKNAAISIVPNHSLCQASRVFFISSSYALGEGDALCLWAGEAIIRCAADDATFHFGTHAT